MKNKNSLLFKTPHFGQCVIQQWTPAMLCLMLGNWDRESGGKGASAAGQALGEAEQKEMEREREDFTSHSQTTN